MTDLIRLLRILDVGVFGATLALGTVILMSARRTMRPAGTSGKLGLMWWHILAITIAVWGWELTVLILILGRLQAEAPLIFIGPAFFILGNLTNYALWLILRVQRARLAMAKTTLRLEGQASLIQEVADARTDRRL